MTLSVFDLFKVGIGPSSSHTVGPMKAARMFAEGLRDDGLLPDVQAVRVCLYGSLGLTGKGHGSDKAVLLGLEGEQPATVDVDAIPARLAAIADSGRLNLLGEHEIGFVTAEDLEFNRRKKLSYHPNAMRFTAYDGGGTLLRERDYYSVGGGFVADETDAEADSGGGEDQAAKGVGAGGEDQAAKGTDPAIPVQDSSVLPYPFTTGAELLAHTTGSGLPVSGIMLANEMALGRTAAQVEAGLGDIWQVMQDCVDRGCATDGMLPGGLKIQRRAPRLLRQLTR
jgi:L-serine dehydratase